MNLSVFIAKRYLISKKSTNVINWISGIAIFGVMAGTMTLIIVLSIFNGFDALLKSTFSSFDPDLKILASEGKSFYDNDAKFQKVKSLPNIAYYVEVIEENALFDYNNQQMVGKIKGVGHDYDKVSDINTLLKTGEYVLKNNQENYAILGYGVAASLKINSNMLAGIKIWVPKREGNVIQNPEESVNKKLIFPSGIFSVHPEYDMTYMITSIEFARELFEYPDQITAVELKIDKKQNINKVQKQIKGILGSDFKVLNRYQQHEFFYKVMESEKWVIFLILSFILIIASFNIIGSLTMLIIEKKKDIQILKNLGADNNLIWWIFLFEGWFISIIGAVSGLILGSIICWIQQEYGIVGLGSPDSFIINAYPVKMIFTDFIYVFITVIFIGFWSAWYPVRVVTRRFL